MIKYWEIRCRNGIRLRSPILIRMILYFIQMMRLSWIRKNHWKLPSKEYTPFMPVLITGKHRHACSSTRMAYCRTHPKKYSFNRTANSWAPTSHTPNKSPSITIQDRPSTSQDLHLRNPHRYRILLLPSNIILLFLFRRPSFQIPNLRSIIPPKSHQSSFLRRIPP